MDTYLHLLQTHYPPDGPIRIGNIISSPLELDLTISSSDSPLQTVTTSEPGRTVSWDKDRNFDSSIWATIRPKVEESSGGKGRDISMQYTKGSVDRIDTVSLRYAPTDNYAAERIRDLRGHDHVQTKFGWKRPVYMITGLKIARGLRFEEQNSTQLGGPMIEESRKLSFRQTSDYVMAIQLYVITEHGWSRKRISIKAYHPKDVIFKETEILDRRQIITCSFRSLQLTRIESLQRDLLKHQIEATRHRGELPETLIQDVTSTLSAYGNAIRDYEMLSLNAASEIPSGAILAGDLDLVRAQIGALLRQGQKAPWQLRNLSLFKSPRDSEACSDLNLQESRDLEHILTLLGYRELDTEGRKFRAERKAYTERLVMGLFGGLALIGPMLIMVLKPSQTASLITVSVATIIFSLVLAKFATDSAGKDVLGATAAYAAVLVVFIGASGNSSS